MNKDECKIIKDLLPNYIEDLLQVETINFVEKHISTCHECKEDLELLKTNKQKEKNKIENEEKMEFDSLKKYNKKLKTFKNFFLITISICIIIIIIFFIKISQINNLIQTSYAKVQELKKLNNYNIMIKEHQINYKDETESTFYTNYYFLNNNYKKEKISNISYEENQNVTSYYGTINSNNRIEINDNLKQIINTFSQNNYETEASFIDFSFADLSSEAKLEGIFSIIRNWNVRIRNDRFNGIECYVLRYQTKKYSFREIWIDIKNMLPIRIIQDIFNNQYNEKCIVVNKENVTNDDISLPQKNDYTVKNINN